MKCIEFCEIMKLFMKVFETYFYIFKNKLKLELNNLLLCFEYSSRKISSDETFERGREYYQNKYRMWITISRSRC